MHQQFAFHQVKTGRIDLGIHCLYDLRTEIVFFENMAELKDCRFVRRSIRHGQADKLPDSEFFMEAVFHLRVTQVVGDLEQMDAKH